MRLAKKHGVKLRQSYQRVGKFALIAHQRYTHAKRFKRANKALRKLKTYLGRIIRDIGRKVEGKTGLVGGIVLERMLARARQVLDQKQGQRGPKIYSLHAPEVECIGKGNAHRPYEFGVKVSVATTLAHAKGGQFVAHVKSLSGNPYDGHTLKTVIPDMEDRRQYDRTHPRRQGLSWPQCPARLQVQGVHHRTEAANDPEDQARTAKALRCRAGDRTPQVRSPNGPNYLWHRQGDATNAILAAVGYNFRRIIKWLRFLLRQIFAILFLQPIIHPA